MNIKWNQIALAAAAGFLLGALSAGFYLVHRFHGLPPFGGGNPVEMFSRKLGLTEEQKAKVSAVFEKYQPEIEKVMRARTPEMEALRKRVRAELLPILTPQQAETMRMLEEKIKLRHKNSPCRFNKPGPCGIWNG